MSSLDKMIEECRIENNDLKSLVFILSKWTKLIDETLSTEDYQSSLSKIDSLHNEVLKISTRYQQKNTESHQGTEYLNFLCNIYEKSVCEIRRNKELLRKEIQSSRMADNDSLILHEKKEQQWTIKLLLILVHTKTVVVLVNLLCGQRLSDNNTNTSTHSQTIANNLQSPLLSTKEQSLMRLSICHSLRLSFFEFLKSFFLLDNYSSAMSYANFEKIFPTSCGGNVSFFQQQQTGQSSNENADRIRFTMVKDKQHGEQLQQEYWLMKPIYLIYLQIFLIESSEPIMELIHNTLRKDCLAILLLLFCVFNSKILCISLNHITDIYDISEDNRNHFSPKTLLETFAASHFHEKNRPFVIRNLLLLSVVLPWSQKENNEPLQRLIYSIVNMFRNHIINHGGLPLMVDATLDSDQASEKETTVTQRLQSMATLLIYLPVKKKSLYYQQLLKQTMQELLLVNRSNGNHGQHPPEIYWRLGAMIIDEFKNIPQSKSLLEDSFFHVLDKSFDWNKTDDHLSIEAAVSIIQRLLMFRCCTKRLSKFFPQIFFLRFHFEQQIIIHHVPLKDQSEQLLLNMLNEIPKSIYLLDDCLCSQQDKWLNRFRLERDQQIEDQITYRVRLINDSEKDPDRDLLEQTNRLATFTLRLLDRMNIDFRFQLFYLLLERLIDINPPQVVLLLIGPFTERLFGATISKQEQEDRENFLLANQRTAQFLSSTMERIVNRLVLIENEDQTESDENQADQIRLWVDTLSICLKILSVLLEKIANNPTITTKINLSDDQKEIQKEGCQTFLDELRQCHLSLGVLLNNSRVLKLLDPLVEQLAEHVHKQFNKVFDQNTSSRQIDPEIDVGQLESALNILRNDDFIPEKVHALITIKRLILNGHPSISAKLDEVLSEIQNVLGDSESYLYLAAIRTLSVLAIHYTDKVLPLLINELISTNAQHANRSLSDRLKIGEVLKQLINSIGDFAYHYSTQFIHGLLCGIQSPEPAIRVSCLSCLGEFCRKNRLGLSKHIVELMLMAQKLLSTDPDLDVRRAVALFLYLLLRGLDRESALLIQEHLKSIKNLILDVCNRTLDEVLQRHCSMAYEEINRIAQLFIQSDT